MTSDTQHFMVYLDILNKNKGIIFLFTFVCVLTVGFVSITMPNIYRASSVVLVDTSSDNILDMQDVMTLGSDYYAYTEYLNTQMEILKSRSIAEQVFDVCNLQNRLKEELKEDTDALVPKIRNRVKYFKKKILKKISLSKSLPKKKDSDEVKYLKLLETFRKNIGVNHKRDTRMIQISYEHENPELATEIVNSITAIYIDYNLKRKVNASREALIWLKEEMGKIKKTLRDKEIQLQKFRDENNLVSDKEKREALNTTILDLNKKITEAETSYAAFTTKYKIKHPKMQQIIELLSNLQKNLSKKRLEAIENEKKFITYTELSQDIEITKVMLEHIMHREKQTLISGATNSNNISVIENAIVPYQPVSPKRKINVLMALIIGLFGGFAWVYLLELFKKHVHSSEDFLAHDMPFLGYIPVIKKSFLADKTYKDSYLLFNHKGIISEIFNNLRTSVILNSKLDKKTPKGKSLVFTSFLPGEGKTLISSNLAVAFAKYRFKVLLVEADLRKPRIREIFKIEKKEGLSDYLQKKAPLEEIISKSSINLFDILPAGHIPENPSELLGSQRFKELVEKLETDYEIIIFDSPPAFSVTDPVILSSIIKKTIIVSKYNSTPKHMIPMMKEKLEATSTDIIGVIINQVHKIEEVSNYINYYSNEYY